MLKGLKHFVCEWEKYKPHVWGYNNITDSILYWLADTEIGLIRRDIYFSNNFRYGCFETLNGNKQHGNKTIYSELNI